MRVLIFTEGGSEFGLGHIFRCSSLYDELDARDIEVEFIVHGDAGNTKIIQNKNKKAMNWLSTNFLNNYIKENDYCIVDSYLASEDLYRLISNRARKTLFIDDNGRINYPKSIIVNPSLSTQAIRYPTNDSNCYLLGPKYIILRNPFIKVKRDIINTQVKEVLITMGGSDINNLTPTILKQLSFRHPEIIFNVVIGNAFGNKDEIKRCSSKNIYFHENATAEEMKRIMLKSDFAITATGQTIHELLATQTPFVPVKVVENQVNNVAGLKEFNLVKDTIDYKDDDFLEKIEFEFKKLLNSNQRIEMATLYADVIDGLGSKRIIDALLANLEVK